MPELGSLDRRQAASLAGLAPQARDSGKSTGYRPIGAGRADVKKGLFFAALAASRHDEKLSAFHQSLIARGKSKITAVVAVMRKLITIANAKIRDLTPTQQTG